MLVSTGTLPSFTAPRSRRARTAFAPVAIGLGLAGFMGGMARAADAYMPIVMPITGFLSVEGGSQRNGAVMALEQAPGGMKVDFPIFDTGTSATGAATALDKALSSQKAIGGLSSETKPAGSKALKKNSQLLCIMLRTPAA